MCKIFLKLIIIKYIAKIKFVDLRIYYFIYYMKGFNNIGNTCYLNAGLQMIIHNKDLCDLIINNEKINSDFENISNLIKTYYNNENGSITPDIIKNIVSKNNKEFIGFNQNDSFEFIIYFLDYIFELVKNDMYEITTKISIKCKLLSCLNKNIHYEKNNFLLLDINDNTNSLDDCYRYYKSIEKLCDDNLYFCEKCNFKRIGSKRTEISQWSKHLIIVLKRFNYNGRSQKINQEIDIPINWRHNYVLKGIVFHSGSTFGGHYIYIGNHNNKWFIFNDDYIKEISEFELNNYKNNGYIYYYTL